MLRNLTLIATLSLGSIALGSLGLTGCHLYFEGEEEPGELPEREGWPTECADGECEPERPGDDRPGDGPSDRPAIPCEADAECQAGCFCSDEGFCEESTLCQLNQDCQEDFTCDLGTCVPLDDVDEPPATCEDLSSEETCLAEVACSPVYRGVNCTSENGEPCTSDTAECTCESFAFGSCEDL